MSAFVSLKLPTTESSGSFVRATAGIPEQSATIRAYASHSPSAVLYFAPEILSFS